MFFVEEISLDAAVVVALSELDIFTLKGNIMTLKTCDGRLMLPLTNWKPQAVVIRGWMSIRTNILNL